MNAFSFLLLSSLVLCLCAQDGFLSPSTLDPHCDDGLDADGKQLIKIGLFDIGILCDTNFYQCTPEGALSTQACPPGDVFVASLGQCVPSDQVKGCGKILLPECDDGLNAEGVQLIKSVPFGKGIPCDTHFYQCNYEGDKIFPFDCFTGGVFDASLGTCVHRNDVDGCATTVDPQCDLGSDVNGNQLIRTGKFGSICGKEYHECDPISGKLSTTTCPSGTAFDLKLGDCFERGRVAGCLPVCEDWVGGFIVPQDCRASLICAKDGSLSAQWCPEGTYSGWNGACFDYNLWNCNAPSVVCPMYLASGPSSMDPYTNYYEATGEDCTGKDVNVAYALTSSPATPREDNEALVSKTVPIEGNDFFVCNDQNKAIHYYCCWGYSVVLDAAPICMKRV